MELSQLSIAINSIYPIDTPLQEAIQKIVKRRVLPKGAVLVTEGQIVDEVHFIEEGLIRAFYYKGRKEVTSWIAYQGRFIWPLPSYILRQPSRDNIQVLETATVLSMNRQDLEELKQRYNVFEDLECRIMERYIVLYDF
jgi:CRP-like cAMP-binding protein